MRAKGCSFSDTTGQLVLKEIASGNDVKRNLLKSDDVCAVFSFIFLLTVICSILPTQPPSGLHSGHWGRGRGVDWQKRER